MRFHKNKITLGLTAALTVGLALPLSAMALDTTGHSLELKARGVHFDRDFETDSNDRTQSALGLQLNYESPYFADVIGVGISGYSVNKLDNSGKNTSDVLSVDNDGELHDSFDQIAQAFVKLKYQDLATAKLGRQLHKTLLLSSSGSRAVPNTFSGGSFQLTPLKGLSLYGARYDQWSSRADSSFEEFRTDNSADGAIDYLDTLGASYVAGPFSLNLEHLRAQDFLKKTGLVAAYDFKLGEQSSLKLTGGIHTSSDDGKLFVIGAESAELDDEDLAGAINGVTASDNDGQGIYLAANWKLGNVELGAAAAKFDGAWIEDNFAGDHGTNPFPTGGVLADFTNNDEKVWMLSAAYDWKAHVPGLKTLVSYKNGSDAKNSANAALGEADENEWAFDLTYQVPVVKGLAFRYTYLDYHSDKTGRLDGVKEDDTDHRVYLDYSYRFF